MSSPLADLQLLRELPSAYPVSYETQHIVLLRREIWPGWNLPIHRLERYVLTNVCGHPYSLQIRSHVSNVGEGRPQGLAGPGLSRAPLRIRLG